jgi:hypothetical protein
VDLGCGADARTTPEAARLIRAFNGLRQYEEKDFASAYARLAECVLPEGLMIEGTSTPFGRLWAANVVRRAVHDGWKTEALVFSTNFRTGIDMPEFQTVLPKNLIHQMVPGRPIHDFFEAWRRETSTAKVWRASLVC